MRKHNTFWGSSKTGWGLFAVILASLIFFSNFTVLPFGFMDEKRLIEAIVFAFATLLFVFVYAKFRIEAFGFKTGFFFGLLVLLWYLSSFFAPLPQRAFLQAGWYLLLVQFALLCAWLYRQNRERYIKLFIGALFILAGLYAIQVFTQIFSGYFQQGVPVWPNQTNFSITIAGEQVNSQGFLNFSNKRFFNHLQTWSLPLLVFGYLYFKDKLISGFQYLMLFFISAWWMLAFAAGARGTLAAGLLSIIFTYLLFRKQAVSFIKVYLMTAAVGFVLYGMLFLLHTGPGAKEPLSRFGTSGRLEVWLFAIGQIIEYPILGLGPMHFSYMPLGASLSTPHNLLLQSMAEWGIPAALLASGLVICGMWRFIKQSLDLVLNDGQAAKSSSDDWFCRQTNREGGPFTRRPTNTVCRREGYLRIALITCIAAAGIHSMVSGILNTPFSQLIGAMVGGWVIGEYFIDSDKKLFVRREKKSFRTILITVLMIANIGYVGYKVCRDIPHLNERIERYLEEHNTNKVYPRFWLQGLLLRQPADSVTIGKDE